MYASCATLRFMRRKYGDGYLPDAPEARATVQSFIEQDFADRHLQQDELVRTLGTMSLAVSSLALEYGEAHPLPHVAGNMGILTHIEEKDSQYEFVVLPQDMLAMGGAQLWKSAGINTYHDTVVLPPATPGSDSWQQQQMRHVYAERVRLEKGVTRLYRYCPFELGREGGRTIAEETAGYTEVLKDLSRTLLCVTDEGE